MKVLKISDVKREERKSNLFVGQVTGQALIDEKMAKLLRITMINFSPGAKNIFHTHTSEQVLYVTGGKGIVATEEQEFIVEPGTMIFVPAGERHWHGATPNDSFSHLSIITPGETKF